jgi:hypothetical protein
MLSQVEAIPLDICEREFRGIGDRSGVHEMIGRRLE